METTQTYEKPPAPRLCDLCLETVFADGSAEELLNVHGQSGSGRLRLHHQSLQSLLASQGVGCYICRAFEAEDSFSSFFQLEGRSGDLIRLDLCFYLSVEGRPDPHRTFSLTQVDKCAVSFELAEKSISQDFTGHKHVLDLAKHWLQECLDKHSLCRQNLSPSVYPTRLLDISAGPLVKLVSCEEATRTQQPYATLSYRWGSQAFLTLTSSNKARFEHGISVGEFPRAFQDIIASTKHLGIKYLWIDCCCIIQSGESSKLDWERECSKMEQVYENSVLNLGILHASSPLDDCFVHRKSTPYPYTPLLIDWRPKFSAGLTKYQIYQLLDALFLDPFFGGSGESGRSLLELFKRGWILQERLLCPRMLYFDDTRIIWECSGSGWGTSVGHGYVVAKEDLPSFATEIGLGSGTPVWSIEEDLRLQWWDCIIHQYSQSRLSYPNKDKLLALSGIAKRMTRRFSDEYVAGMFRKELLRQLCWARLDREPSPMTARSREWRAPSWSWLSIDGAVEMEMTFGKVIPLAKVTDVHMDFVDSHNPWGALKSASLQFHCRPIEIEELEKGVHLRMGYIQVQGKKKLPFYPDDNDEAPNPPGTLSVVLMRLLNLEHNKTQPIEFHLDKEGIATPILEAMSSRRDMVHFQIEGLILQKSHHAENAFSRLGAMRDYIFSRNELLSLLTQWSKAPQQTITLL